MEDKAILCKDQLYAMFYSFYPHQHLSLSCFCPHFLSPFSFIRALYSVVMSIIIICHTHYSPTAPPSPTSDRTLNDEDHCEISAQLGKHSAKWREIGAHLGFLQGDMDTIQALPSMTIQGPKRCLDEMLAQWLQSAPGDRRGSKDVAKLSTLKSALIAAGFARTAHDLTLSP